mgnify:CR=1 FL=1
MGKLTVICGPMFSGKSTELLRRIKRAILANIPVVVLKPHIDTRSVYYVKSHDGNKVEALAIFDSNGKKSDIIPLVGNAKLVAIDEVQFLNAAWHVKEVLELLSLGKDVIVAGLDLDYAGQPFGPMPLLLAYADEVIKLSAVCVKCGKDATRTQRLTDGRPAGPGPVIQVGGAGSYEARCADCWVSPAQVAQES